MKKYKSILLSILSCSFFALCSANAFAVEGDAGDIPGVETASDSDADIIGDTPASEAEPYEFDSYHLVDIKSLYMAQELNIDGGLADADINTDTDGQLTVTDTQGSFSSGSMMITEDFNFDSNPVGRVVVDGYAEKGVEAYVDVYIDDASTPICSIRLPEEREEGENESGDSDGSGYADEPRYADEPGYADEYGYADGAGEYEETKYFPTADVYSQKLKGVHKVSFGFNVSGKNEDENAYIILKSVEFAENSVPVLYFDIDESQGTIDDMNESPDHSARCYGSVDIQVPDGYISEYTGQTETDYKDLKLEYIRGRGNSTWGADKKPYKFKLDKGADLFGMGKNKHWVLVANRYDNSNMRNKVTYWLGAEIGMEFTPQCIPVEVVMGGRYYGTYLLAEQVRIGTGRVEIDELDETDYDAPAITGGYLASTQPYPKEADENKFNTQRGVEFLSVSPDFSEGGNESQWNYLTSYFQTVEDAVFGKGYKDEQGYSYTDYMDLNALVDYWWIQEFSANGDAFITGSTYLYKKREGKLFWGPLWDFDFVAWGDLEYLNEDITEYMVYGFNNTTMLWIDALKRDTQFINRVKERWPEINEAINNIVKEGGLLDSYYEEMKQSASYNYELWGAYRSEEDYKGEVEQLRGWINARLKWVNDNFEKLDNLKAIITYIVDGEEYDVKYVSIGETLRDIPEVPAKEGYYVAGWYDENDNPVNNYTGVDCDMNVYAKYVKESDAKKIEEVYFVSDDIYRCIDTVTYYPIYSYFPEDALNLKITWSSSDESIATVGSEDGVIALNSVGDTVISAINPSGESYSFNLHVTDDRNNYNIEELKFESDLELYVGEHKQHRPMYSPVKAMMGTNYSIADSDIATVDSCGVVTGISPGETTLSYIDWMTELEATCKVIVSEKPDDPDAPDDPVTPDDPDGKKDDPGKKGDQGKTGWITDDTGTHYIKDDGTKAANEWIDGRWLDKNGNLTYKPIGKWKLNSTGWWFEDTDGWYPKNQWQKINGKWYFFTEDGYMDYSEYREGYWLGDDGAWDEKYYGGHWCRNSIGWWYEDVTGYYPYSKYLWIDGVKYWFNSGGYME